MGGGSARNQLKDLEFAEEIAGNVGLDLPVSSSVRHAFEGMISVGDGDLDHTGILRRILPEELRRP